MDRLPIFLRLADKRCLVVGGGVVAERKIRILLRTGAALTVVAPKLNEYLGELARGGRIHYRSRRYSTADIEGHWLVVAATDDDEVNRQIAADCESAGRFCNAVDDNAASGFILPALVDRSPVVIAIGTGGNAPVLAQQLKASIEAMLPSRIGELAEQAGHWRDLVRRRYSRGRDRRRFWQRFFDGDIAERLLAGRRGEAERLLRRELIGTGGTETRRGEGWIVGAGPGDPALVTLRAQQLIGRADIVLYDRLVSRPILDFARKDAELIHVGKSPASATNGQAEINELLVRHVAAGERVCRLKGGDPFVFGRGGEEIRALVGAGLPFQVVPGISAALGCAAYAGIPLTYRGISASVTFATARLDRDLSPDWPQLLNSGHTLCLYMGIGAIDNVRTQLLENGVPASLPVAIVECGTTPEQRLVASTVGGMVDDATAAAVSAPALVYIGEVAAMAGQFQWYGSAPIVAGGGRAEPTAIGA